ncbi:MlaE family ABC transporter permease [Aquisalimonas asiatica]|uniref:Phospholipid/cholesterol/gamma-HCH transport system permease protein n=1 Tax=Aquisalimonas asiatica TaxID=406100 RepID=A0A1H8Q7B9_9GAMM|nr:ABC transporter permease [Aquisalimonas asiatica]SEO50142.1 phospholipid/cholesterol/gamma-HCH transport system permease protein [Aquisalimonas asiatica]
MTTDETATLPSLHWDGPRHALICSGDWTWEGLSRRMPALPREVTGSVTLETDTITGLDTAGALCLHRHLATIESRGDTVDRDTIPAQHRAFLELVDQHRLTGGAQTAPADGPLHRLGRATMGMLGRPPAFLAFTGAVAMDVAPRLLKPHRIRWREVVGEIDHGGVRALPILGLLIFLTGVVIAYQGGAPLQQYGANIFLVDLLSLTMLREMAPLMTAIIVAGRTGSAYAAQIGTMHMTEEVDALRVIGITPYEMLVLPKLLAMLIVMPLLTIFANVFGMLGGMSVASLFFDVGFAEFLQRMPEAIATSSFWVGIIKAPVFAILIVMVSCYHGFHVERSTESVGRATTRSVVQGIFLVIVADAAFSVVFNMLNL